MSDSKIRVYLPAPAVDIVIEPVQMIEVAGGLIFLTGITQEQIERHLKTGSIYEQKESTGVVIEPIALTEQDIKYLPDKAVLLRAFYNQLVRDTFFTDPEESNFSE